MTNPYQIHYRLQQECTELVFAQKTLLLEYRDYQCYFENRTPSQAEDAFYNHMCFLLDVQPFEEGRYSLEHRSLKSRMMQNRAERKVLSDQIRKKKEEIRNWSRSFSETTKVMEQNILFQLLQQNLPPKHTLDIVGWFILYRADYTELFQFDLKTNGEFTTSNLWKLLNTKKDDMISSGRLQDIDAWEKKIMAIRNTMRKSTIEDLNDL
jgi:hypothetical protein